MKNSQIALLSAFGVVLLVILAAAVAGRLILQSVQSGDYDYDRDAAPRAAAPSSSSGDFDLEGFTQIDARGIWKIRLEQGEDWDVQLTYPERMADRLDVHVENGRLVLGYDTGRRSWWGGFGGGERFEARIVMPEIQSIDLSGASEIDFSGFSGDALSINSSGASEIDARDSRFDTLSLTVSGAGDVDLGDVPVGDARVVLSGAGSITLDMDGGELSGTVSGAGKVRYHGTVSRQSVVVSGFSSVDHVN
jgi:Putative auto-transporter adhesin, head GIN domain